MRYANVLAGLQAGKEIRSWIIVVLVVVIAIEGVVIQRLANRETPIAVVPGSISGLYTPGAIPQDVILQNFEMFVNNLTNYNPDTFAKNLNAAVRMMTSKCRATKNAQIKQWQKEMGRFNSSSSFYPKGEAKVISKDPYVLEYVGTYDVRSSAGTIIQSGVKTVRILVVNANRTRSNLLGYAIDDWEVENKVMKK